MLLHALLSWSHLLVLAPANTKTSQEDNDMDPKLEQARTAFFQGIKHFESGRLEQARAAFEASLDCAPGRPSVLGNLGITLFRLQRWQEAIPLLKEATVSDPTYAEAWTSLGLAHEALGHWQDAVDALKQAVKLSPQQSRLWLSYAQSLLRLGRAKEALQAFDGALLADPECAAAWSARGNLMRELLRPREAAECFENALAFGGDPELNGYYLASVTGGVAPPPPPRQYVESLFDDYAPEFQNHVVGQLRYQGYEVLLRPLIEARHRFPRALDLGCGTGLCGPLVRPLVDVIDGVDISQAMLEQARKLGVYRELIHADIGSFLEKVEDRVDLVLAADVFIYVGDLEGVFRSVRRILAPGGRFAFTVEEPSNAEDLQLLPSLRYAHSEAYVRQLALACGFKIDDMQRATIRVDQAKPIQGLYVYLR